MHITASITLSTALVVAVALSGCHLFDPPAQLEAKLSGKLTSLEHRKALARHLVEELKIEGLALDNVRIAYDEERKAFFFRVVGKKPLPPALLDQVSAGLARISREFSWQGKLIVDEDPAAQAILETDKREFPIQASWLDAEVKVYLLHNATDFMPGPAMGDPSVPRPGACVLSFAPKDGMPTLTAAPKPAPPAVEEWLALMRMASLVPFDMRLAHRVTFDHAELEKLEAPTVKNGKVLFQFARLMDTKLSLIPASRAGGKPLVIDYGTVDICRQKLGEVAPAVQALLARAAPIADAGFIGPAQRIALPVSD